VKSGAIETRMISPYNNGVDTHKTQSPNRMTGPIMPGSFEKSILCFAYEVLLIILLVGCTPAAVEEASTLPAATISNAMTTPVPSDTLTLLPNPSSTPEPSPTTAPSNTPEVSPTSTTTTPSSQFLFYCVTSGGIDDAGVMPADAVEAELQPGGSPGSQNVYFIDIPKGGFSVCRAQYNHLSPGEYILKISEGAPEGAFLQVPMTSHGNVYGANVKHYYILHLPVLRASFNIIVGSEDSEVYWQDELVIQNRFFIPLEATSAPNGKTDPGEATKVPTSYTLHP
jgi:hypothetical protein